MVEQRHQSCYQAKDPSVYQTVDPGFSALIQQSADQKCGHTPNFPMGSVGNQGWSGLLRGEGREEVEISVSVSPH